MEEAMKERRKILEDLIPEIFQIEKVDHKNLIKNICLHIELDKFPNKIMNPAAVKVKNLATEIIEKNTEQLNVVDDSERRCPLLGSVIKKPWKSTCGHIYEEEAVLGYLQKERYCVVHGCNERLVKKEISE